MSAKKIGNCLIAIPFAILGLIPAAFVGIWEVIQKAFFHLKKKKR